MNEVTRIHLGREAFTIGIDAHKSLKAYLAALEKQIHDKEVLNEVEIRMSELLLERGVADDKVIIAEDVEYLQEQLGDPDDFSEDEEASDKASKADDKLPRKLFRNTDGAIIGGVAAGLASYSGIDATIIRILFLVLAVFGSGLGLMIYVVLWIAMPAAETTSEKLQMQGKPVTLEALKESVANADINGTAKRVNRSLAPVVNGIFRVIVKLIGLGFVLSGLFVMSSIAIVKIYMLMHHGQLFQENIFPVGVRENWLVGIAMVSIVVVAIFMILTGIAAFKRAWPIRAWTTGVLAGMFLLGSVATIALTADAVPRVRDRYNATVHTTVIKDIQPFNKVDFAGRVGVRYISSPNYAVELHYVGDPDVSKVKVNVQDGVLHIDSTQIDNLKHCSMLCLSPSYDMVIEVYAPNVDQLVAPAAVPEAPAVKPVGP